MRATRIQRRGRRIRTRIACVALLVVSMLLVVQGRVTEAQTTIDPTIFAAPLSVVTSNGGDVAMNRVEDNATAAGDPLFLRASSTKSAASFAQQGRQTGYEAEFFVGTIAYVYSASIFGSAAQADAAFAAQQNFWRVASGNDANSENPTNDVGDTGMADWWNTADVASDGTVVSISEQFFARGRILGEVYLDISAADFSANGLSAIQLQDALAQRIDQIAASAQVSPTQAPTNTPQPIATSIPPTATPIPPAKPVVQATAKPAPKKVKCKKGYKVVKGKCVKKKKGHLDATQAAAEFHSINSVTNHVAADPQIARLIRSVHLMQRLHVGAGTVLRLEKELRATGGAHSR